MLNAVKLWKLRSTVKSPNQNEAYAGVLELGRLRTTGAVDLLISALDRQDGVGRSAARELGNIRDPRAVKPLAAALENQHINRAAAEALVRIGGPAVEALISSLGHTDPVVRMLAADVLGQIGDKRAINRLVDVLQGDPEYAVRTAAAAALGHLKDSRAVWALVGVLKLRDEAAPERHAALESLRQAANLAMRRIGDPFAVKAPANAAPGTAEAAVAKLESELAAAELHPRLLNDLSLLSENELADVLKELIAASEEVSWAKLESREPMLPPYFQAYDQRRETAELIGAELNRRGGTKLMKELWVKDLASYAAIRNWWQGIGGWQ